MENFKDAIEWEIEPLDPNPKNPDLEWLYDKCVVSSFKLKSPEEALENFKSCFDEGAAEHGYNGDVPYSSTLDYRVRAVYADSEGNRFYGEYFYL